MRPATRDRDATAWLALLRGINVVGRNKVPMKALASALEAAGFKAVRTYIQSGNVLFRSAGRDRRVLASRIARLVERCLGVPATARNWRTVNELLKLLS